MRIAIASAGRRAHYVEWFREALRTQRIDGEIIALEYSQRRPTLGIADRGFRVPAYNSDEFRTSMTRWVKDERPQLLLSLNDYEHQIMADGLAEELRELGCEVLALDLAAQSLVIDKHRMAAALIDEGLPSPRTWLGGEADRIAEAAPESRFAVKHRYGSGSTGLQITSADHLAEDVEESARTALDVDGRPSALGAAGVVVQELLPGREFGVDGVYSLDGQGHLLGVLARRKDEMRGGDTDVATTVRPEPFADAMAGIGRLLRPRGPIDVDFRETADGELRIIDINPRLGGGYPFCHRAGADLPAAIVRLAAGLDHDPSLLDYCADITTARREEFTVLPTSGIPVVSSRGQDCR